MSDKEASGTDPSSNSTSSQNEEQDISKENVNADIQSELLIKHPLENCWKLWFYRNDRSRDWKDNIREVITFNTVEDFWALYNHIELVSKIDSGCDYCLFKNGIMPMWEDPANVKGGRWLIPVDRKQRHAFIDDLWLEVMLCLIGEAFGDQSVLINGAVIAVRPKAVKIGVWLADSSKESMIIGIGMKIKESLGIDKSLGFEVHDDNMKRSSSTMKSKFMV